MILSQQAVKELKKEASRLEGLAEGLSVFHPQVSRYMLQRVNAIQRIVYEEKEDKVDPKTLSGRSKPGFEFIDQEVMENPSAFELAQDGDYPIRKDEQDLKGKIEDRKIMEKVDGNTANSINA